MNEEQSEKRKRNLKPFWILLIISGLPYILSWIYFANRDNLPDFEKTNRGELIEPVRSIDGLMLPVAGGEPLSTASLKGNWVLVTAGRSACQEGCQRNVYHLRQIRRLMGEDRKRIKRMFVLLDTDQQAQFVDAVKDFGEMAIVDATQATAAGLLEQMTISGQSPENRIFIVDPLANLIMVYGENDDPVDIAKDFRRLLKVTRIGQPKEAG